jgi:hypothetical protein
MMVSINFNMQTTRHFSVSCISHQVLGIITREMIHISDAVSLITPWAELDVQHQIKIWT